MYVDTVVNRTHGYTKRDILAESDWQMAAVTVTTGVRARRFITSLVGLSSGTSLAHVARDVLVSRTEGSYTHRYACNEATRDTWRARRYSA